MNTPKFHVATTIDGITVDIRVAIDPVDAKLSPDAFTHSGKLISEASAAATSLLGTYCNEVAATLERTVNREMESRVHRRGLRATAQRDEDVLTGVAAGKKEAAAISDPIIKKLEAANEKLRNELDTLKAWPGTKPRRAKKGGAK